MLCLSGFELYSRWVPLINFQSIFATKTVRPFVNCCLTFSFSIVYYGKQGPDTFDDGYVDGIY